jgi:hypothetical protein
VTSFDTRVVGRLRWLGDGGGAWRDVGWRGIYIFSAILRSCRIERKEWFSF